MKSFRKFGIEEFRPLQEQFDPNLHEVVEMRKDGSLGSGVIVEVFATGFIY